MSDQPANISHANRDVRLPVNDAKFQAGSGFNAGEFLNNNPVARKKFVAKGHDAQLEKAQYGRFPVTLTLVSGAVWEGTIVKRDKFTITLRHNSTAVLGAGMDEIFYKHAIEGVLIDSSNAVTVSAPPQ